MDVTASNAQTAPTDQTDLRVASTKEQRARFTRLIQTLLSISSEDCDLALIQIIWSFRNHLITSRRRMPSRLRSVLFDIRNGKLDNSTEARLYQLGASRTVKAFCAALQEEPAAQGSDTDRESAISKHGGHHAMQAFRAAYIKDGDIGKTTSLISEYGGTQALTIYAIVIASDARVSKQVENLSDGSIYCLLDCISNVRPHSDVLFMIETLFRQRQKPDWIPHSKHIGRRRTSRQRSRHDHRLPGPNQQAITRNVAQGRSGEVDTQPASRAPGRVSTPPPPLSFGTGSLQPNLLDHWLTRDLAADDASQAPVPAEGSQVLDCLELMETNLSELIQPNFHYP